MISRTRVNSRFSQQLVHFLETFVSVARFGTIRFVTFLAARDNGIKIRLFDIETAYLNRELKEKVFMKLPLYQTCTKKLQSCSRTFC